MPVADEIQWLLPHAAFWQAYDSSVKTDLSSSAVILETHLLLFDPIALSQDAWLELCRGFSPTLIVLTNANHQRASLEIREKHGTPILAPASARSELQADQWLPSPSLPDGMESIDLPGFAPGETAYYIKPHRILVVGDALINLPGHGFSLLPGKYCTDAKTARQSIRKLLDFEIDLLLMAHGEPLRNPAPSLAALLK